MFCLFLVFKCAPHSAVRASAGPGNLKCAAAGFRIYQQKLFLPLSSLSTFKLEIYWLKLS